MKEKHARAILAFSYDPAKVSETRIRELLDAAISAEFRGLADCQIRWVSRLADASVFGSRKIRDEESSSDKH
jgi:hypothetical protein